MAPKYSSAMGAMRASLVLVLLLAAVAAVRAGGAPQKVSCENQSPADITVNGVLVKAYVNVFDIVVVDGKLVLVFKDKTGKEYKETYDCPQGVSAVVIVYVNGILQVKVKAVVGGLLGLLKYLLGKLLGSVVCLL